jgi:glycosyltransferase involved in cell wall biosynthesis
MADYTLGLFANMYPAFEGDYRGIFIQQMVRDLESRGVFIKKAVKTSSSVFGYVPFLYHSLVLSRDHDLDLMQADYIPHSSLVPAYLKRTDVPLILKFHGDDVRIYPFKNRFNLMLTKSMLRRATHVITGSEEMKRILISQGEKPERISAIHTGVDTVFFSPLDRNECRSYLGLPTGAPVFLFVGRLHPWKGVNEIVEVARACPEFTFVFLGPGDVPVHTPNCRFIGTQVPGSVRMWLNAADCIILPTYTESVPTAVMEAFSCGTPAITTDVGGCPEIVEDGKTGLLVPVRDVQKLKEAVIWMERHPEERIGMGHAARTTAVNRFDHILLTDKLIAVHTNCLR